MSEMKKVYELPKFLAAPESEVGRLARRLIEYADLSCVRPLLDELDAQGRERDSEFIRDVLGAMMVNRNLDWQFFVIRVGGRMWFDLFDLTESLAALEASMNPKRPLSFGEIVNYANRTYTYDDALHIASIETNANHEFSPGDPVYAGPGGIALSGAYMQHGTPPVGVAASARYEHEGKLYVDVRFSPARVGASGGADSAPSALQTLQNLMISHFAGQTPSLGSPDPSNPPAQG